MYLDSIPHTIKGFKFEGKDTIYPDWFEDYTHKGKAHVVINEYKLLIHVTLYDVKGDSRRAYEGDWICLSVTDTLFPMSEEEVNKCFTLREEG